MKQEKTREKEYEIPTDIKNKDIPSPVESNLDVTLTESSNTESEVEYELNTVGVVQKNYIKQQHCFNDGLSLNND